MPIRASHNIRSRIGLAFGCRAVVPLVLTLCCGSSLKEDSVNKKTMDNLYYAYEEDSNNGGQEDTSLTMILEIYSLNPEIFGDPVRIVSEFDDSLTLCPIKRRAGLIVTDRTAQLPAGIRTEEISGGTVLAYSCQSSMEGIDECWARIGVFAREHGYELKPPGIEVFENFRVESYSDTAIVELIVRIE